jgi:hypothetical protein
MFKLLMPKVPIINISINSFRKENRMTIHKTKRIAKNHYQYRDFSIVYTRTKWGNVWDINGLTNASRELLQYDGEAAETVVEAREIIDNAYIEARLENRHKTRGFLKH